nr:vegetative cell wall protein gp1-like [Aegilops tauschii subsp. strangulata]
MLERKCYECQEDGHGYPTLDDEESPSPKESSSTSDVHMCLIARGTTEVSSNLSNDNGESDDECDRDMSQEIYEIGNSLRGVNKNTYEIFKDLITHFGKCNDLLHEEQEQNDKLDCNLLDALETLRDLESSKEEIEVAHDKLKEDFEHLDLGYKNVKGELAKLSKSYEELQATHENNYGKLEESHEKLSGSHDDLLISHERLKLAHEAIVTKGPDLAAPPTPARRRRSSSPAPASSLRPVSAGASSSSPHAGPPRPPPRRPHQATLRPVAARRLWCHLAGAASPPDCVVLAPVVPDYPVPASPSPVLPVPHRPLLVNGVSSPSGPIHLPLRTLHHTPSHRHARRGPLAVNGYAQPCLHARPGCPVRALATCLARLCVGAAEPGPVPTEPVAPPSPRRAAPLRPLSPAPGHAPAPFTRWPQRPGPDLAAPPTPARRRRSSSPAPASSLRPVSAGASSSPPHAGPPRPPPRRPHQATLRPVAARRRWCHLAGAASPPDCVVLAPFALDYPVPASPSPVLPVPHRPLLINGVSSPSGPIHLPLRTLHHTPSHRHARRGPLAVNGYAQPCARPGCPVRALATCLACLCGGAAEPGPVPTEPVAPPSPRRAAPLWPLSPAPGHAPAPFTRWPQRPVGRAGARRPYAPRPFGLCP